MSNIFVRAGVFSLTLLLVAQVGRAQQTAALMLDEAVARALGHPEVEAARAMRDAAAAGVGAARSRWLPHVRVSETFMRSDNPVFVFGSLLEQGRFGQQHFDPAFLNDPDELDNFRLALDVRYPIFDRLDRFGAIQQASLARTRADLEVDRAEQAIRSATIRAYLNAIVADSATRVAEEAVRAAEANVAAVRERVEAGLTVHSDLLAADVQLAEMEQQAIVAAGDAAVARAALATTIGAPVVERIDLPDAVPGREHSIGSLAEELERARAGRADIRGAALDVQRAEIDVRTRRASYLPRLDFFATYGSSGESIDEHDDDRAVGVVLSVDLLAPGRLAAIHQARAAAAAASAQARGVRDAADFEVVAAYHRFDAARRSVEVAKRSVASAREATRIIRDRYEAGLTTITELLRAETALLRARTAHLQATSDYHVGYAELLRATGRLTDVPEIF